MTIRLEKLHAFVSASGAEPSALKMIAGDASMRKYYRVPFGTGQAVVMDAPPEDGEDVRPFVRIARYLTSIGLSAPEIFAADTEAGFLLLEDLGDDVFARLLEQKPELEPKLYRAAVDVLSHLHLQETPKLETYSAAKLGELGTLAYDWYTDLNRATEPEKATRFRSVLDRHFKVLEETPPVLIQRDYHAENLLWLPGRSGIARVGLLDFQDAMLGHPAYDLVSILQDARRDVPQDLQREMLDHFIDQCGADRDSFHQAYYLLGVQRNLRIVGVFARLWLRDSRPRYVDLIPRVWGHVMYNLDRLSSAELSDLVKSMLPEPDETQLNRIRKARS